MLYALCALLCFFTDTIHETRFTVGCSLRFVFELHLTLTPYASRLTVRKVRAIRTLIYISRPDTFGLLNGHVLDNLS